MNSLVQRKTATITNATKHRWLLLPVVGCTAFTLLYIIAASFYPGGSQANAQASGFSWMHNYWCNLLNETALNGVPNPGRPAARLAMVVLVITLPLFFVVCSQAMALPPAQKKAMVGSGIAAVVTLPFLSSGWHDVVIDIAGVSVLVAFILIYRQLYQQGWYLLFRFGLLILFLAAVNNYLYYFGSLYFLPLVQKITFAAVLLWVVMVTLKLYRNSNRYK